MKTRSGFVSNSSSSSFIVAFKKVPKSVAEMQKMLFGKQLYYSNPYYNPEYKDESEHSWLAQEVSIRVFEDMKNTVQPNEIEEELKHGYIVDEFAPKYNDFSSTVIGGDWEKRHENWLEATEKYAKSVAKDFIKDNPEATFYKFRYSDNDGNLDTALEHGDLFNRLPHVKVGNH